jgi:hypothetical protein
MNLKLLGHQLNYDTCIINIGPKLMEGEGKFSHQIMQGNVSGLSSGCGIRIEDNSFVKIILHKPLCNGLIKFINPTYTENKELDSGFEQSSNILFV